VADGRPIWLVPLAGGGAIDGAPFNAGGVWLAEGDVALVLDKGTDLLVAYPGQALNEALWPAA
jgi:mannose-6-phosphate isomerase